MQSPKEMQGSPSVLTRSSPTPRATRMSTLRRQWAFPSTCSSPCHGALPMLFLTRWGVWPTRNSPSPGRSAGSGLTVRRRRCVRLSRKSIVTQAGRADPHTMTLTRTRTIPSIGSCKLALAASFASSARHTAWSPSGRRARRLWKTARFRSRTCGHHPSYLNQKTGASTSMSLVSVSSKEVDSKSRLLKTLRHGLRRSLSGRPSFSASDPASSQGLSKWPTPSTMLPRRPT
mmetsp:Transcript_608/g.1183  ORF Transcript_608/g.1183 Transcript_608/m.1183 type:complete len:231 (-) Transcript_608:937-1629(-)